MLPTVQCNWYNNCIFAIALNFQKTTFLCFYIYINSCSKVKLETLSQLPEHVFPSFLWDQKKLSQVKYYALNSVKQSIKWAPSCISQQCKWPKVALNIKNVTSFYSDASLTVAVCCTYLKGNLTFFQEVYL